MKRHIYDRDAVLDLWGAHKTSPEISALTGVPIAAITRIAWRARKAGDPRALAHRANLAPIDFWTDERVGQLIGYWAQGFTGQVIGRLLGASRSAVIGKAYRLGLTARRSRQDPAARRRRPSADARQGQSAGHSIDRAKEAAPASFEFTNRSRFTEKTKNTKTDEPASFDIALIDLERGQCKWPHGEGPFLFCGHKVFPNEVYCPYHCRLAYRPHERQPVPPYCHPAPKAVA